MRIIGLSSALILIGTAVAGATLLPRTAAAQKDKSFGQIATGQYFVMQDSRVRIPLKDAEGVERGNLTYIPGGSGTGVVTITDRAGAQIELLVASKLRALPALNESNIRMPAGAASADDGKADGGSNDQFLKAEMRKLDARIKQLEARLGR